MYNISAFLGNPLSFKSIFIYPPSVLEVLETKSFLTHKALLTITIEDIHDEMIADMGIEDMNYSMAPSPFEYLLAHCYNNPVMEHQLKEAIRFFTKEEIAIDYETKVIFVGDVVKSLESATSIEDLMMITEDNFHNFQNLIRLAVGESAVEKPPADRHEKAWRMLALRRERDRIKAQSKETTPGISLESSVISLCVLGIGITPFNLKDLTYAAARQLLNKYREKESYDITIRSLTSGFGSKDAKIPSYWMEDQKEQ